MDITVNNLGHTFDGCLLFDNLSFQVCSGQRICIAGGSGSGKSTLLKILAGLVVPTAGEVSIGADRLTQDSVWGVRNRIGYVAQEPDLGDGPVLERIRRPFTYHANAHLEWDHRKVVDYCQQFRLNESLLEKNVGDLSGGEKQRVAIIIAMLLQRPVLLLDEPMSALDVELKVILKDQLLSDRDRTILFVSHETTLLGIADDTIYLSVGEKDQ